MVHKHKPLDTLEYVLSITAVVGLLLFAYLNMSYELKDPDIWLHLKTGEYIVQHKAVPQTDIFSSTIANKGWIDHSWLVQVIFYLVFHFGGADNLIFLSAIIVTFAFLFLFFAAYTHRKYLVVYVSMLFLAIISTKLRFNIRPENFSILFFAIYLLILSKQSRKSWIFLLPLVQVFWVNSHGFFILGPLMVGVFILAERLKRANFLPWEWSKTDLLDKKSYTNLIWVFFMVCLACLINPYGYRGALYPLWITFNSLTKTSIFYKYIDELLPTWVYFKTTYPYYIFMALSLAVFALNFRRINLSYLVLWLIFLGISFKVNRNIIFFNFFAFIVTANGLAKSADNNKYKLIADLPEKQRRLLLNILKLAILAILITWSFKGNCSILSKRYYIFEENRSKSALLGINEKAYPVKAADFILKNDLPDNLFNFFNHGSYLIYRFYPKKKVFIDGRTEMYGDSFFKNYQRILNGDNSSIKKAFGLYNINTVLISEAGSHEELYTYFFNNPGWALVYLDENSLIFLKNSPENKALINRLRIDLKKWKTQKADLEKIGLKGVYPDPYVKRGWIFYYLGLNEQALSETKEALRILPSCAEAYNVTGRIYLRQKLYIQAFEALRLASIYAPFSPQTLVSLGDYYTRTSKTEDAIKTYRALIKASPDFAEGFYLLSRSYSQANNTKSEIIYLRCAIKLNPFEARYYKRLGELFEKNNDYRKAATIYKQAIAEGIDKMDFYKLLKAARNKK